VLTEAGRRGGKLGTLLGMMRLGLVVELVRRIGLLLAWPVPLLEGRWREGRKLSHSLRNRRGRVGGRKGKLLLQLLLLAGSSKVILATVVVVLRVRVGFSVFLGGFLEGSLSPPLQICLGEFQIDVMHALGGHEALSHGL